MQDLVYNSGDLSIDNTGDLSICSEEDIDVIQTANNSIYLRYGHNKFHNDIGNKVYTKRIKLNDSGIEEIIEECTEAIIDGDDRVIEITSMKITQSEDDEYRYIVDYGLIYQVSVDDSVEDDYDEDDSSGDYDEDDDVYQDYDEDEEDDYDIDDSDLSEDEYDEDEEITREVFGRAFII